MINNVTILGAGIMGAGISQLAAESGFNVTVCSPRLSYSIDIFYSVKDANLVIEAIPENLELKKRVLGEVSKMVKNNTLIATNTSSFSINQIAEAVIKPERFIGMHFFNPPTHMRLVELIPGAATYSETFEKAKAVVERLGKTPIIVEKDVSGFIVNRILITYLNEAAKLADSGKYTIKQIDAAMKYEEKMPLGPFMLSDFIGIDIVYHILKTFEENLDASYKPAKSIVALFDAKKFGRKTKEGFYSYVERPKVSEEQSKGFDPQILIDILIDEAEKVVSEGIADEDSVDTALKLGANLPKGPFELKERR